MHLELIAPYLKLQVKVYNIYLNLIKNDKFQYELFDEGYLN